MTNAVVFELGPIMPNDPPGDPRAELRSAYQFAINVGCFGDVDC